MSHEPSMEEKWLRKKIKEILDDIEESAEGGISSLECGYPKEVKQAFNNILADCLDMRKL